MATDWTTLYKKHKGQWLALDSDETTLIASGKTAKEAWDKAQKKGHKKPILTHMPKKLTPNIQNIQVRAGYEVSL